MKKRKHLRLTWRHKKSLRIASVTALCAGLAIAAPGSQSGAATNVIPDSATLHFGVAADLGHPANDAKTWVPSAGMASSSTGNGYWVVNRDGIVSDFGDAANYGDLSGTQLAKPIVGIAPTSTGKGYFLAASDGGVFTFGDAQFKGSLGAVVLNKPIVAISATPSGLGYLLAASDGGVFTFGDATFVGSAAANKINMPVVAISTTPSGNGYWLAASDGGIFAYGDAGFLGSMGGAPINQPIMGMARTASGKGYWLSATDGGVFNFGDAPFLGAGASAFIMPIRAFAANPQGTGYWQLSFPDVVRGQAGYYPEMPLFTGQGTGKRIVYCNVCQRLWLVESDETVFDSYLISGRQGVPTPGLYQTFTRELHTNATDPSITMDYFMAYARGQTLNLGFHTIPIQRGVPLQTEAELGQFRSHGCIRQDVPHAIELWNWAPLHTPVYVTG